jgi:hypothetical protein
LRRLDAGAMVEFTSKKPLALDAEQKYAKIKLYIM